MRAKKTLMFILSLTLVVVTSVGVAYAAWSNQIQSKNIISMGSVRGQIVEEYEQGTVVYPGATVKKLVQVSNTGSVDMLARVKVNTSWDVQNTSKKSVDDNIQIQFDIENWYFDQQTGFYYYQKVLAPGEITEHPLFSSFKISADLDPAYANTQGTINILMECVQAGGNGVQFWDKTLEELDIVYTDTVITPINVGVAFKNAQTGFVFDDNQNDLFANFKNLVPGETCNQMISLKNDDLNSQEIFLRADVSDQVSDEKTADLIADLLEKYAVIRVISQTGELLYHGPAAGNLENDQSAPKSMKKAISLGNLAKGEAQEISVELSLDSNMDNRYQSLLGQVDWIFSAAGTDTPVNVPKTGYSSNVIIWLICFAASMLMLIICVIVNRKNKTNQIYSNC